MVEGKKINVEVMINGKLAAHTQIFESAQMMELNEYSFYLVEEVMHDDDVKTGLKRIFNDLRNYYEPLIPEPCDLYDYQDEVADESKCGMYNWDYESKPIDQWGSEEFAAYNLENQMSK